MPEIKHQFTGGKMNKDLDERLIKNGEYRDAMNVQVSTSEGSDVGTIQNILGNSLVPGQGFIGNNATCVGSIADEKSDKLYYFIDNKDEILQGTELINSDSWDSSSSITENYSSTGVYLTSSGGTAATPNYPRWYQHFDLVDGETYKLNVKFSGINNGGTSATKFFMVGRDGGDSDYRPYYDQLYQNVEIASPGNYTNVFTFDQSSNNGVTGMGFYVEMVNGSTFAKKIRVDSVSLTTNSSNCIIEYDSKTNSITPVLIDTTGDVLQFSSDRVITGINIIDDMLFWTDNHSEPKKINIPRSIQGTDSSGLIHTDFINEKTGVSPSYVISAIKEEHITVIKKQPKLAPRIDLVSERYLGATYSGVMRITSPPFTPTVQNTANLQNDSSMRVNGNQQFSHFYDFSQLNVGSYFDTQIETDINGDSGFDLAWAPGDTLLFKEFGGDDFDDAPPVPLTSFSMKAEIIDSGINDLTDQAAQFEINGDFMMPDVNGFFAIGWAGATSGSSGVVAYNSLENKIDIDVPQLNADGDTNYRKIYEGSNGSPVHDWVLGATYKLTFEISDWVTGVISCNLVATNAIVNPGASNPTHVWYYRGPGNSLTPGYYTGNGTYTHEFTLNEAGASNSSPYSSWVDYQNKIMFQTIGEFEGSIKSVSIERLDTTNAQVRCRVIGFDGTPPVVSSGQSELRYAVDKLDQFEKLFEFNFPRIAYRYRYQDGEYSAISPFSQVSFMPGAFDYHPKKGYNIGMSNRVKEIKVGDLNLNRPDGVVEIDIIYKDDSSPNLYVVDTIKPSTFFNSDLDDTVGVTLSYWEGRSYTIKSEQVSRVIESNQLLRPWDNVPKKALAQDISGNRIIYGNYTQGYDLIANGEDYFPDFNLAVLSDNFFNASKPSIKSLREYQVGAVFVDKYGRETPVVSNLSSAVRLEKATAKQQNKFEVSFHDLAPPEELEYVKFFIKETSGEYYNIAMDRYYDADDGQVWLSFPSSERNKIALDDFIILKKALESNSLVEEEAKYKVLDIQNEAPEFIKYNKIKLDDISHILENNSRNIFGDTMVGAPASGLDTFKVNYEPFSKGSSADFGSIEEDIYVDFKNDATGKISKRYKISSVSHDWEVGSNIAAARYTFRLDNNFDEGINFITDDSSGSFPTKIIDGIALRVYKYKPQNSAKFDGKFFVKIDVDPTLNASILAPSQLTATSTYRTTVSRRLYMMRDNHNTTHQEKLMFGANALGEYGGDSSPGFGRMAPFFRNYTYEVIDTKLVHGGWGGNTAGDFGAGMYRFGPGDNWQKELGWVTTSNGEIKRDSNSTTSSPDHNVGDTFPGGTTLTTAKPKIADDHGWDKDERHDNTVWFIDEGPRQGVRSHVNNGYSAHWVWTSAYGYDRYGSGIYESGNALRMDLAVGGIYHPSNSLTISNFWNVGNGAEEYSDQRTIDLRAKLNPGEKFRWREDPTHEIYTMQKLATQYGFIRHTCPPDGDINAGGSSSQGTYPKQLYDEGGPETFDVATSTWSGDEVDDYLNVDGYYRRNTALLSPNYTANHRPEFLNSSGGNTMPWDPTTSLGAISGGLELTIIHDNVASTITTDPITWWVRVNSLSATNHDGTFHNIQVGMILISHSNGDHTLQGSGINDEDTPLLVWKIEDKSSYYKIWLCGYTRPLVLGPENWTAVNGYHKHELAYRYPAASQSMIFAQPTMNGFTQYSCNRMNAQINTVGTGVYDPINGVDNGIPTIMPVSYHLDFVEEVEGEVGLPDNPAIWETEVKENTPLDIYYEASGYNPLVLTEETKNLAVPIGSLVEAVENPASTLINMIVTSIDYNPLPSPPSLGMNGTGDWRLSLATKYELDEPIVGGQYLGVGDHLKITKPDGSAITVLVTGWDAAANWSGSYPVRTPFLYISSDLYGPDTSYTLNWHNCFSFGNGVESNRIRDAFNLPFISNGVKASTTVLSPSEGEEHRKYGLIYSGIYNSTSGTNHLNQFIAAEKITKDINPIYGSIQKLHSRDTDLVTLCEDKILRILANKDALFNADGNPQLTANINVLGQTIPFVGEYGISTDPESFASESYRAYFTDRVRGAVMRLSKDGLTPISEHGMKDWFRDNLSLGVTNLLGENNLASEGNWDIPPNGNSAIIDGEAYLGYYNNVPKDIRFGQAARLKMLNVMEVGKTYRIRYDVVSNGANSNGLTAARSIALDNRFSGSGWVGSATSAATPGTTVDKKFVANRTDLEFLQYQVNSANQAPLGVTGYSTYSDLDGNTITALSQWVTDASTFDGNWTGSYFYGSAATIKNIILEEVKEGLKIIGGYDDRQKEYNVTIHGTDSNTVSFKENVKGWVSFKSFTPENAISCANDYYTMKDGKLWQHHNPGANRNTFYGKFNNSSFDVILNDMPSSIKSYHALDYEGSQSRVEGIKTVEITGFSHNYNSHIYGFFEVSEMSDMVNNGVVGWSDSIFTIKQYRDNVLIYEGMVKAWDNVNSNSLTSPSGGPTKGHLRKTPITSASSPTNSDFQVGDIISTQLQEDSASYSNSFAKDGWYVSGIETDKEKGSLLEFVEKEGKWFNYISGVEQGVDGDFDFGSFDVQGLGVVQSVDNNDIIISGSLNASLQIGDIIYYEQPSQVLEDSILDVNVANSTTADLTGSGNDGYTIVDSATVIWSPTANTPNDVNYLNNITTENIAIGGTYLGALEVSNYNGTGSLGFATSGGVDSNLRVDENNVDASGYAKITKYFVATASSKPDFFARDTNSGTIKGSIQKVVPGGSLGFTRLEANQLQKAGVITSISNSVITVDNSGTIPLQIPGVQYYCMFVKNQIINMSGLSGYYANAKFENNSKIKAELFSVSSEISESSK